MTPGQPGSATVAEKNLFFFRNLTALFFTLKILPVSNVSDVQEIRNMRVGDGSCACMFFIHRIGVALLSHFFQLSSALLREKYPIARDVVTSVHRLQMRMCFKKGQS